VLAVDLAGGFEALLARSGSGRKRKKHRAQARKLEAAVGCRRLEADSPEDVARLLDAFLEMKAGRFREAGIPNVFAPAQVRRFFQTLFTDALACAPRPFVLQGLEVGGRLRAVTGSSVLDGRMVCEFGGITDDELAHASPGDFLFYQTIEEACGHGLSVYDFGVGDEPYKRSWCDIELRLRDVTVPLGARGQVLAAALRLRGRAVEIVKGNPRLWQIAKAIRRRTGGGRPPSPADRS
jgi:CelD/BcsL family acetyltransferase involved in cellulose biosynthesis